MNSQLLNSVMEISEQMIEVGAEIHRVEDSIARICAAYGVARADVYATTFNVIVSIDNGNGSILTHTRRIKQTGTDIERLHRLNTLVRYMTTHTPDPAEVIKELENIRHTPNYPIAVQILFYGVIAAAFCLFFGGKTVAECAAAGIIGCLVGCTATLVEKITFNKLLSRFLCSFVACSLSFICLKCRLIGSVDNVIIGNIMSLIPGIGLTNSLRDLFTGDSITGILRSIEAVLLALAIACGYILTALLFGGVL